VFLLAPHARVSETPFRRASGPSIYRWATGPIGLFNTTVAGQPAPYNGVIGSDIFGPNFSATWTFTYVPPAQQIQSATLTLGIYDDDAQAAGNQVVSFTLNGSVDLTSNFSAVAEGHGGANGHYDVLTESIPAFALASLAGGTAAFSLALVGPGMGVFGLTPFNGAGIDFSSLSIATATPVPEPSSRNLLLLAAGFIAFARRRLAFPSNCRVLGSAVTSRLIRSNPARLPGTP